MPKNKPKIGLFSLTCCEGCEFSIFELNEKLLPVLKSFDIVDSRILLEKSKAKSLDIAFVEGSVITEEEKEKLLAIRKKSNFLVALGACATIAGINRLRNGLPLPIQKKLRAAAIKPVMQKVYPLEKFVTIDYRMQGCPINEEEFLLFLNKFFHKALPKETTNVPVCFECKLRENGCLLLKGQPCLGPVTNSGCNALCPSKNAECIGCRGYTNDANFLALKELFVEFGLNEQEIKNFFEYFNPNPFKKIEEAGR